MKVKAADFLGIVRGLNSSETPVRLGTVHGDHTDGDPRIRFDGETDASSKTYPTGVEVAADDRVVLAATGATWSVVANLTTPSEAAGSIWDHNIHATEDETADNVQDQDHTELQFEVAAGEAWYVELYLVNSANNTSGDIAVNFVTTGTWATGRSNGEGVDYSTSASLQTLAATAFPSTTRSLSSTGRACNNGDGLERMATYRLRFVATADGTAKVTFGVNALGAGRTATIHKSACLLARRVRTP